MDRIDITPAAAGVLNKLRVQHGPLMFHQSGGCCDGSSPMCYAVGDFIIGSSDVWLGQIDGCDFWMSGDQFEYWQHTHLTIDVTPGRGASFSLEIPMGVRFQIRSRLFDPDEMEMLTPVHIGPLEEVWQALYLLDNRVCQLIKTPAGQPPKATLFTLRGWPAGVFG